MKATTRFLGVGTAAAAVLATASVASAQLPGVDNTTMVFPVDDQRIQIAVEPADIENGTVAVTVQNNTSQAITCQGREGAAAGAATPATITARSVDFYENFPHSEIADLEVGIQAPSAVSGSINLDDLSFNLGSIQALIPGSAAGMYDPEWGALGEIGGEFSQARRDGHVGYTGNTLTLPANQATPMTINLGHTSRGERQEFQAGFFMTCEFEGQRYVFYGYEGDVEPVLEDDEAATGSLGSLGAGSLNADSLGADS